MHTIFLDKWLCYRHICIYQHTYVVPTGRGESTQCTKCTALLYPFPLTYKIPYPVCKVLEQINPICKIFTTNNWQFKAYIYIKLITNVNQSCFSIVFYSLLIILKSFLFVHDLPLYNKYIRTKLEVVVLSSKCFSHFICGIKIQNIVMSFYWFISKSTSGLATPSNIIHKQWKKPFCN